MKCKWCNSEIKDIAKFCENCGAKVEEQNIQATQFVYNESLQQNNYIDSQIDQPQNNIVNLEESVNVGLVILSVLIPVAGLIIFLMQKDTDMKTAKASGIAALISFIVNLLITIIIICIFIMGVNNAAFDEQVSLKDSMNDNIEVIEPGNTDDDKISTNWDDYEVIINWTVLELPCSYSELSRLTSTIMQTAYENSYLQSGYYGLLNLYKNDKLALSVEILNDTNKDILYSEGKITRITQTSYHVSNEV